MVSYWLVQEVDRSPIGFYTLVKVMCFQLIVEKRSVFWSIGQHFTKLRPFRDDIDFKSLKS